MFTKVLIPTDGSEPSKKAIEYYFDKATTNSEVILFTATPAPRDPRAEPPDRAIIKKGEMWEHHQNSIAYAKNLRQDVILKTIFKEGVASDLIAEIAEDEDVDAIIIGNRGLGGVKEWLLGSTCRAVASKTRKPVLIIKS
jgi:nucleotide-binding universal stress UspA family protein